MQIQIKSELKKKKYNINCQFNHVIIFFRNHNRYMAHDVLPRSYIMHRRLLSSIRFESWTENDGEEVSFSIEFLVTRLQHDPSDVQYLVIIQSNTH